MLEETTSEQADKDVFNVFVPGVFQILEKAGDDVEVSRSIGGFASTEDLDRQGEIVVQKGLDFSEFVSWGWFNDNHRQETSAALGYPTDARLEKGRWWVEGNLIPGYPPSDRIWELAKSLARMQAPRKLGFSIEGKVVERDGYNKILRAKVRDVAITRMPVNTSCSWSVLTKAFADPSAVSDAADKALSVTTTSPAAGGPGVLRPEELESSPTLLTSGPAFQHAMRLVKHRWPHLTEKATQRAARFVVHRARGG